ncbi:MAG: glycosyltransferase [Terriglobia bacterium]
MRILVVGPVFADSFADNVVVTLQAMGHTVVSEAGIRFRHHGNRYLNAFWRELDAGFPAVELSYFEGLLRQARNFQPELVLVTHGRVPPQVVAKLKQSCSGKVACWYTDSVIGVYRHYLVAAPYDVVFLKEPFLVRAFREKLGTNAHYLPECCNPMWHKRMSLTEEDRAKYGCDVAALGTLHYWRAAVLKPFADYDLKIWGTDPPSYIDSPLRKNYTNHYVTREETSKALGAAKVAINTIHYSEIEGVNKTLFAAAGCGAFEIAEWKPALPQLFEPEREIVTYRTGQELKEKVDYYLARPEERAEISEGSYARAQREHTYELRLKRMLDILGFTTATCEPSEKVGALRTQQ